ncbi:MAG: DUF2163 domain-containing protein [Rickettsiales bacterium]|nr:DUF2163 domain-containing protein [Rickettsiales bacterium]
MKKISENLKSLLKKDHLKLAKCFKITLNDGEIIALTEYSTDLCIDGTVYKSSVGAEEMSNNNSCDLSNNGDKIIGLVDNDIIKLDEVLTGKFDNAEVEIFYLHLDDENMEKITMMVGKIVSADITDGKVYFNVNGVLNTLNKTIGDVYSPLCRAEFCDHRCSLNISDYMFSSKITVVKSETEFLCNGANIADKPKNYFKYGFVKFVSGKNTGQVMDVKQSSDNDIVLNTKLSYSLTVGDEFNIYTGCDKTFETCINTFNNAINFRGEPNIPSTAKVYKFY